MLFNKRIALGNFQGLQVIQWLRFPLPIQGVWVQFLIRQLVSHVPPGQKTKTLNRNNIVTDLIRL